MTPPAARRLVGMEVAGAVDDEICFHKVSTIEAQRGVQVAH
jgi:hypothetical protein